jgi:hypothetical protein
MKRFRSDYDNEINNIKEDIDISSYEKPEIYETQSVEYGYEPESQYYSQQEYDELLNQKEEKEEKEEKVEKEVKVEKINLSLEEQKKSNETLLNSSIKSIEIIDKLNDLPDLLKKRQINLHDKYNPMIIISLFDKFFINEKDENKKITYKKILDEFLSTQYQYGQTLNFFYILYIEYVNLKEEEQKNIEEYIITNKYCFDIYSDTLSKVYEKDITIDIISNTNILLNKILKEIRNTLCVTSYKITYYKPEFEYKEIYKQNVNKTICYETITNIESGKIKRGDEGESKGFVASFYQKIMDKVFRFRKLYTTQIPSKIFNCLKSKMIEYCTIIANNHFVNIIIKQAVLDVAIGSYSYYQGKSFNIYKDYLYQGDNIIQAETVMFIQIIQILAITLCKALTNPYNFWKTVKYVTNIILDICNDWTPIPFIGIIYNMLKKTLGSICMVLGYFSNDIINGVFTAIVYSQFTFICGISSKMLSNPKEAIKELSLSFSNQMQEATEKLTNNIIKYAEEIDINENIDLFLEKIKTPTKNLVHIGVDNVKNMFDKSVGKYVPTSMNPFNYISNESVSNLLIGISEDKENIKKMITGSVGISAGKYISDSIKQVDLEIEENDVIEFQNNIDDVTDKIIENIEKESKKEGKTPLDIYGENYNEINNKIEELNESLVNNFLKKTTDLLTETAKEIKSKTTSTLEKSFEKLSKKSTEILTKKITKEIRKDIKLQLSDIKKQEYIGYIKERTFQDKEETKESKEKQQEEETKSDETTSKVIKELLSIILYILKFVKEITFDQLVKFIKNYSVNYLNKSYDYLVSSYNNFIKSSQVCIESLASFNIKIITNKLYTICNSLNDVFYYFTMTYKVLDCADEVCDILFTSKKFSFSATNITINLIKNNVLYYTTYFPNKYIIQPYIKYKEMNSEEQLNIEDKKMLEDLRERIKKRKIN